MRRTALTIALALLTGGILVIAGVLRLGLVAHFLAKPVLDGFIIGLEYTIAIGQAGKLVGVHLSGGTAVQKAVSLVTQAGSWTWLPFVIGAGSRADRRRRDLPARARRREAVRAARRRRVPTHDTQILTRDARSCFRPPARPRRPPSVLDRLDLAGPPGLVEPGLERPVEAKHQEPALAGHGLEPVRLFAGGRLRTEVHVH